MSLNYRYPAMWSTPTFTLIMPAAMNSLRMPPFLSRVKNLHLQRILIVKGMVISKPIGTIPWIIKK